jgi:hypothetical protein
MRIWQRGTSFSTPGSIYTADRFTWVTTGVNGTATRSTDIPNAKESYSLKFVPVSSGTPTEFVVRQYLEQQNIVDFAGSTVTVSAWVKCSKTSVKFRCTPLNATGGSDVNQYRSVVANTWTKITATFSTFSAVTAWTAAPNDQGGFLDIGFQDSIALTTADELYITGVQLERGSTATEFERRPIGTELALCQRYYLKLQPPINMRYGIGRSLSTTLSSLTVPFPVSMRVRPTALEQSGTAGHYGIAYLATAAACTAVPTMLYSTELVAQVQLTNAAVLTAGQANEAYNVNASGYLAWSAEL